MSHLANIEPVQWNYYLLMRSFPTMSPRWRGEHSPTGDGKVFDAVVRGWGWWRAGDTSHRQGRVIGVDWEVACASSCWCDSYVVIKPAGCTSHGEPANHHPPPTTAPPICQGECSLSRSIFHNLIGTYMNIVQVAGQVPPSIHHWQASSKPLLPMRWICICSTKKEEKQRKWEKLDKGVRRHSFFRPLTIKFSFKRYGNLQQLQLEKYQFN